LVLAGAPAVQVDGDAHGGVVALVPDQGTAGQGTPATFTLRITNTGSALDTFSLSAVNLPPGVSAQFEQSFVDVPPGASNFRDVLLTITPSPGTLAGNYPFTVNLGRVIVANNNFSVEQEASASGTVAVVENGVNVALSPASGAPGSTFEMTVTNTGS